MSAPIYSIMTPNPDVVGPKDTLEQVRDLMNNNGYHHLPVVENGILIGIISQRDYLKVISSAFDNREEKKRNEKLLRAVLVQDVMSKNPVTIYEDQTVHDALAIFNENKIHALPVVNTLGKLEGIVTVFDFLGVVDFLMEKANAQSEDVQFLGTNWTNK